MHLMENDMNIELEEVVVQDVTDDALEMAAGEGVNTYSLMPICQPPA